jgi:hypothetical protein
MKIKLGKLPSNKSVRATVSLPVALKGQLDRYARLHSETWGQPVDVAALIPHILTQFLENDRAFRQSEKANNKKSAVPEIESSNDLRR